MKTILVDAVGGIVDREGNIFKEMYDLLEEFPNRKIISPVRIMRLRTNIG